MIRVHEGHGSLAGVVEGATQCDEALGSRTAIAGPLSALQVALRCLLQERTGTGSLVEAADRGESGCVSQEVAVGHVAAQLELDGLDQEQRRLFLERLAAHQRRFVQYVQREQSEKVSKIQSVYPYLCYEECVEAMNLISEERRELDDNIAVLGLEDEAVTRLADRGFELVVRQEVAFRYMRDTSAVCPDPGVAASETSSVRKQSGGRMRRNPLNRGSSKKSNSELMLEGVRIGRRQDGRLCLDEALRRMEQTGSFDGWSEARIKAWMNKDANPNAYYYRFNDPGEEQRNGKWTKQEHERFMQRLKECRIGENYEWGIFSMALPGRVGYQCSNYYRTLLKNGMVTDDNYYFNEKGEPKFRFKTKNGACCSSTSSGSGALFSKPGDAGTRSRGPRRSAKRKRLRWEASESDAASDDEEAEYIPHHSVAAPSVRRSARSRKAVNYAELECPANPLDSELQTDMDPSAVAANQSAQNRFISGGDSVSWDAAGAASSQGSLIPSGWTDVAATSAPPTEQSSTESAPQGGALCELNGEGACSRVGMRDSDNPLPDFIDVITMEPIRRPAISPSGHVLGYLTWRRLLQQHPRNTCPFTKKSLKLSDLTLLTHENIHEYAHRIVGR
ncbi:hypothetical protein CCYA_CCYA08G2334 [Cyanidiococcus yangmingshanensis]|nr:hypothetical protein CCYA_CCYA08G2334 [Cyanidiococcus yangmingshanensis]